MGWAIGLAEGGASGTEFIGLIVYATLVPAVGLIAAINAIGLPIYMAKHKPRGVGFVLALLSLIISVALALFGAYDWYTLNVSYPEQAQQLQEQNKQTLEQKERQYAADNAQPEISKEEAIALLKSCQLSGFYYTGQTDDRFSPDCARSLEDLRRPAILA